MDVSKSTVGLDHLWTVDFCNSGSSELPRTTLDAGLKIMYDDRLYCIIVQLCGLPLEILETVLMRAFMVMYASDSDDRRPYKSGKSRSSERRAFTVLSSVSWCWRQTLCGWPESPTRYWLKHQLRKLIRCVYCFYAQH